MEYLPEGLGSDSGGDEEETAKLMNFGGKSSIKKFGVDEISSFGKDELGKCEEDIATASDSTGKSSETKSEKSSFEDEFEFSNESDFYSGINIEPFREKSTIILEDKVKNRELSRIEARLNIISQLKELWDERKTLKLKNNYLHRKCKNYLGKYKISSYFEKPSGSSIYEDKRYGEVLDNFKSTQLHAKNVEDHYRDEVQELEMNHQDGLVIFEEINQQFVTKQLQISDCLEGKFSPKKIQFLMKRQGRRIKNLTEVRVKFLKLRNSLERITDECERLNDYGEGRTVNLYTNLSATKNRLAERLDEREEEVGRIRKQIFTMTPILSHMKETSHGLSLKIEAFSSKLKEIEGINDSSRMTVVEQRRKKDSLRKKFSKLHQTAFLLVNPKLLRFLLDSVEEYEILKEEIGNICNYYSNIILIQ